MSPRIPNHPAAFRAVTWNVHHGSELHQLGPTITDLRVRRTAIWLLQEVKPHQGLVPMLRRMGYGVVVEAPEFAVAWDRDRFDYLRHRLVLMSPTRYWTLNRALVVVLRDRVSGRRIKCVSYHTPAHVQAPRHPSWPRVWKVLHEAVATWNRIARRSPMAVLMGGDDNVDEHKGWAPGDHWRFMLDGPLRQLRAPRPTHGRRRIDDFRVRGLVPLGSGAVLSGGPSDHDAHVRTFDYAGKP